MGICLMKSNNEILNIITDDDTFYKALERIMKGHPRKDELIGDLYQELLLIFAEYDNNVLNNLVEKGHLKFYWVRIALNQWQSSSSPFYMKYRKGSNEDEYDMDLSDIEFERDLERVAEEYDKDDIFYEEPYSELVRRVTQRTLKQIEEELDRGWYLVRLFKEYTKLASYKKLSDETRIPESSIGNDIRLVKRLIKKEINKELERLGR